MLREVECANFQAWIKDTGLIRKLQDNRLVATGLVKGTTEDENVIRAIVRLELTVSSVSRTHASVILIRCSWLPLLGPTFHIVPMRERKGHPYSTL